SASVAKGWLAICWPVAGSREMAVVGAADMQGSCCLDNGRWPVSCTGMWTRMAEATRRLLIL
ncbi:hypothetical protein, partial [Enterobacter hormaechei]|uniref:hypothetical protein n=1 Tax=Enterobacter hormaechei TaxID=158836 RepID=UPI00203BFEFD